MTPTGPSTISGMEEAGSAPSAPPPPPGLRRQMQSGVLFWGAGNLAARAVRLAVQLFLAWLLNPTDYGLVAMTAAFMLVLQTISEFGVGVAVIQKKDMSEAYPASAFWLNLAMSMAMFAVAWAGAPWLAAFYGAPEVTPLARVSAAGFLIIAMRTIPMAILRKRLQFGVYATLDSLWNASSGILSLLFAWFGAGYWSLVVPSMIMGVIFTPAWFYYAGWRPRLAVHLAELREIVTFSANVVGVSLLALLLSNAGFILVGHAEGPGAAGLFKFATDNAMSVVTNFTWMIASVVLSGFALQQDDPERLRRSFQRVYVFLTATTFPIHAVLFALAPWLFSGVFPDKWAPAIPLFRVMIVWSAVRSLTVHLIPFFNAANRSKVGFAYIGITTVITLPAMIAASRAHGMMGVAASSTVLQTVCTVAMLACLKRVMGWQERIPFVRPVRAYVLAGVAAAGLAALVAQGLDLMGAHGAVTFCCGTAAGAVAYTAGLYCLAYAKLYDIIDDACPERIRPWVARILPPPVPRTSR